jgi:hypothetical protein
MMTGLRTLRRVGTEEAVKTVRPWGTRERISVLTDLEHLEVSSWQLGLGQGDCHSDPAWPARVTKVMEKKGLDLHYRVTLQMIKEWARRGTVALLCQH